MVMKRLKRARRRLLDLMGIEVKRADVPARSLSRGIQLLRGVVAPKTVIDVGVAQGTPELYAHFLPAQVRYLLVEANPIFKADLERLKAQLGATVIEAFCGAENGEVALNVFGDPRKSSAYRLVNKKEEPREQVVVPVRTLDDMVHETKLPAPYLIKVDVEGAEREVMRGATETLKQTEAVIAEAGFLPRFENGTQFAELIQIMDAAGFAVFDLVAPQKQEQTMYLMHADLIFVRRDAAFRFKNLARRDGG